MSRTVKPKIRGGKALFFFLHNHIHFTQLNAILRFKAA